VSPAVHEQNPERCWPTGRDIGSGCFGGASEVGTAVQVGTAIKVNVSCIIELTVYVGP
jgi:hypothetical protein